MHHAGVYPDMQAFKHVAFNHVAFKQMLERYKTFQPKPNTCNELNKVLQTIWDDLQQNSFNKLSFVKRPSTSSNKLFLQGFELLASCESLKCQIFMFSFDFNTSNMMTRSSAIAKRPRCSLFKLWQNISAKSVHLTLLYVTALTLTNHHFTVLRYHVGT